MKKLLSVLAIALLINSTSCTEIEDPTPCRKLNRVYYTLEYNASKGDSLDINYFNNWLMENKEILDQCPERLPNPFLNEK